MSDSANRPNALPQQFILNYFIEDINVLGIGLKNDLDISNVIFHKYIYKIIDSFRFVLIFCTLGEDRIGVA
ncbi:MAG: hypothetical protein GY751_01275 [Bacteroidetes bacterium]|nr:hypothetical protein [Bacteroidota bacterium]